MFGDTLRDQGARVLFGKPARIALPLAVQCKREALANRGERDEALLTWNLVDEHRRAARQN